MFAAPELIELASAAGIRAVLSKEVNGIGAVMEAIECIATENADRLRQPRIDPPTRTAALSSGRDWGKADLWGSRNMASA